MDHDRISLVGRSRKSRRDLPQRVYERRGKYFYVHKADNRWEQIGRVGQEAAMRKEWALRYGRSGDDHGTVSYWLDKFLLHREALVKIGKLATRTVNDNKIEAEYLRTVFGEMLLTDIIPADVGEYLDHRGIKAWVRANRERALLSALFTWLMRKPETGVTVNPCRGVKRNTETKRKRYVSHEELAAVTSIAVRSIWRWLMLIYRTAQRPEDCLQAGPRNVRRLPDGRRVLRIEQGKTGAVVEIVVTQEIDDILVDSGSVVVDLDRPFVCTEDGKPYTYDGASAMLRRYVKKCGLTDFGARDLRAKAATDLYLAGEPLERIQQLLGHDSVTTTERYIKARLPSIVNPNTTAIASNSAVAP